MRYMLGKEVPNPKEVECLLHLFERELFWQTPDSSDSQTQELRSQLEKVLQSAQEIQKLALLPVANAIMEALPKVREELLLDAAFGLSRDPAAQSIEEIILSYPGFRATLAYRVAHTMLLAGARLVSRMVSERIHSQTGIDIHPGAKIEAPFFIDHGTGLVIGETAVVGKNVHVYQGVTLGALAVDKTDAGVKRHPTVGDNVVIYANSTILGGTTEIGHDSVIGGNAWLTRGVAPYSIVYTEHKTIVRDREQLNEPINFSI